MDLNSHLAEYVEEQKHTTYSKGELKELVSLLDLTMLTSADEETEEKIVNFCNQANSTLGPVAAVCVMPHSIPKVVNQLKSSPIKIASVANFPSGREGLDTSISTIQLATSLGANEIDLVFPYPTYLDGKQKEAFDYIKECKKACQQAALKVILEISEFPRLEEIYSLSLHLISLGVDFIKTSTGRSKQGATIEAASAILLAIKASGNHPVGFKASGSIKTVDQALPYIKLAKKIMGDTWIKPKHLRIGASSLGMWPA
jgi:deoxyribose-phosphate aldolase